jgi:aspartyl-tRNA(Asn)/glutamyl-tRNA(Gln) amidotransferase subunit C
MDSRRSRKKKIKQTVRTSTVRYYTKNMTKEELSDYANSIQISLTDDEAVLIHSQINNILDYVSVLEDYDCQNSEEFQFMIDDVNRLREDISQPSIPLAEALQNAANKNENFFKVPKVIE